MKSLYFLIVLFSLALLNSSCQKPTNRLEQALRKAGKNRPELESVLSNYSNSDTLKYRAACFLIENMADKLSTEGQKHKAYRDTIIKYHDKPSLFESIVKNMNGRHYAQQSTPDLTNIEASYLIENIDMAFKMFNRAKWSKEIDFDNFCEYILPYRLGNEPLESWRKEVLAYSDSVIFDFNHLVDAGTHLVKTHSGIKRNFIVRWGAENPNLIDLNYSVLNKVPIGSCKELSDLITFVLRAYSLPTARDFTPSYANLVSGHNWNAIIVDSNHCIPFAFPINTDSLGAFKDDYHYLSKVYRHTFSDNPQSHARIRGQCPFLPDIFNNPNILDVTDQYIPTHEVTISVKNNLPHHPKYAYISTFNQNPDLWLPMGWGTIHKERAEFKNVGSPNIYLPLSVEEKYAFPINDPFILWENGQVEFLKPDKDSLITLNLNRKYPLYSNIEHFINRMVGGKFQGANSPDFSNAINLYEIEESPGTYFNSIDIETNEKFRYIRYLGPKSSYGNIASLEFYDQKNGQSPLNGIVIGTEGSQENDPKRARDSAFDGNVLTYFDSLVGDSAWVGLDLGLAKNIKKIRFIARTDYNIIVPGNIYELFYWDNKWISLGQQEAESHILTYKDAPSNALFLLKNHTEGKQERIFTYEDNKQIWW